MSRLRVAPVILLVIAALSGCGGGNRAPAAAGPASAKPAAPVVAATPSAPAAPATPAARPSKISDSEFGQMRRELGLTPAQEVAFSAKVAARDAALQAWSDGPDGKRLAAARAERTATTDPAKRVALDSELTRLNAEQWKVRTTYRAEVMQVLTLEQQRRWAAARLGDRLLKSYAKLGLDEPQKARVRTIAVESVANLPSGAVTQDPYLSKVLDPARIAAEKKIEAEVMTEAQRAALAERHARKKPAAPAMPAAK